MPDSKKITSPIRVGFAIGGFPADVLTNLREPHWTWGMGPDEIVVAHDATRSYPWPIGVVRIFDRPIVNEEGDARLRAACMGGVFVLPNYRSEGIGRILVDASIKFASFFVRGYDVAVVHSPPRRLYVDAGFRPIGGGMLGLHLHDRFHHFDSIDDGWSTIPEAKF